jgi:formylmethanofuran dehydrogenase subunit C
MSALTFTLKATPQQRIDLSPLTPDLLAGKSRKDIEAIVLQTGNRRLPLAEFFRIKGTDAAQIVFADACDKLDHIGTNMGGGHMHIDGDAGAYLAFGLRGGHISLQGDAGAFAACGMKNGLLEINGNVGDFLAAALPGEHRGMAGGTVMVRGDAGDRVGDHMRRGAVLIAGNAGSYCGARMTAGTIAVLGRCGSNTGFAMKRGTLLLRTMPEKLPVTFNDCGSHAFGFLPMLTQSWKPFGGPFARLPKATSPMQRYMGDLANNGKGEILVGI